ncbi:MAG: hypothetical protein N2689_02835 [Verrucomicrobiae bacterium]|nr:hypothetical protein [Verrucomicrobiae bacterium]
MSAADLLPQLENDARAAYEGIPADHRAKMGACVAALPDADGLQQYLATLREAWLQGWCNNPGRYPHLLLRLYHCVAFLRYEGNAFWASFGEAVGDSRIADDGNWQGDVNKAFARIAEDLGLKILCGVDRSRHLYVQSAVRHVGIPVRVWRGFVEVCERLFVEAQDWKQWPDARWEDAINLWLGGRKNLRAFFVENRPTAAKWIDEMLEARRILEKNPDWTLDDVAQVSHLRPEYFDEVPETAIFLRPTETESLFRDRPRLRLRWQPGSVAIHIETPRLKSESLLPSEWFAPGQRVKASTNPVAIPLHGAAFTQDLPLKLVRAGEELKVYRLRGLSPWGLWSESSGSFISLQARELPMDDYVLVSKSRLEFANSDGWLGDDEDETRWNQEARMPDGSTCFVSRLVPDARRAMLEVAGWHRITFAPRVRLELRVFPRVTERFFLTFTPPNSIALPAWPRFVLKAPKGLLADTADETQALLQNEFRFFAGDTPIPGNWRHDEDASRHLEGEDVFFYRVQENWLPTAHNPRPARVLRDFGDLGRIEPPPPTSHQLTVQLRAKRHGVIPFGDSPEILFTKESPLSEAFAKKLEFPFRDYWPWHVLTVTQDHATWEEMRLAFDLMNYGNVQMKYYPFQQIEKHGMAIRRGRRWTDFQNRIHFGPHQSGNYTVRYSGLTDAIYAILREIEPVEKITARWERGHPPHLEICFSLRGDTDKRLRQACQRAGIRIMKESLWTR